MYHTKKRTFSQSEITFIKKITNSDKPKQQPPTSKKQKIDEEPEDKPPVSFIFIGNLNQPFELTDAKNKQYLRAKLSSAAPQWDVHVLFVHLELVTNDDLKLAKKTLTELVKVQKSTPIGILAFLPGSDTNLPTFSEYISETLKKLDPMVCVGIQTLLDVDLSAKDDETVKTYQASMLALYQMFMEKIPRVNVVNLMNPAEYRPKTKVNSFLDRISGRIRALIPDVNSYKTLVKQKETSASTGVIDFGNAEQQQAFKNLAKPLQANGATFLRSTSSANKWKFTQTLRQS